ncbi:MAG: cupin domain-containing protein [Planctomycetota bacterium]|nr:cupin domain-containing protein [Planctomycetota bacterium]
MGRPAALALLLALAACRTATFDEPHVLRLDPPPTDRIEGILVEELFVTPTHSASLVTVVAPLPPHYHARHEETVVIVAGTGRMWIDDVAFVMEPGLVVHVPMGSVHSIEPDGALTALTIFTPPFDGVDRVLLEP